MRPPWYTAETERISFSRALAPMHESPLSYAAKQAEVRLEALTGEDPKKLVSQRVGGATHALLLEGAAAFERGYVVTSERRDPRTATYQQVLAHAAGRQVLSEREHEKAVSVATAVRKHEWVADFIREHSTGAWQMVVEQPMRWSERVYVQDRPSVVPAGVDPWAGIESVEVECKGITDALCVDVRGKRGVIIDAKEVPTTRLRPLFAHLEKRLYHVQAAHYLAGAAALLPSIGDWAFYWVAYEGSAPHDTVVVRMSTEDAEYGERVRTDLIRRIIEHRRTGRAPGRHTEVVESSLPAWETRDTGDVEKEW